MQEHKSQKILQILFLLVTLVWPFGQLLEIPFFVLGAHLYLLDLVVFLLFIYLLLNPTLRQKLKNDPLTKHIAVFIGIASISLLVALPGLTLHSFSLAFFYLLRFISYTSLYFGFKSLKTTPKTTNLVVFSLSLFTLLGLAQYLLIPDARLLFYFGFDDHYYRLIGTLFDPNFTGLILLIFILFLLLFKRYYLTLIPALALALTFSRATYLVTVIIFVYLFLRSPKRIYLVLFSLVLLGVVIAPKPSGEGVNLFRTFSIYSRIEDSQYGLTLFLQKPILGHGFNTLRSIKVDQSYLPSRASGGFSNSFIFILVTTGIIGFFAYLNLLFRILNSIWSNQFLTAMLIAIILHSFFNNSLFYIWILVPFWLISANKKL